ncbi:CHASE3 domain-containing protein [Rhodoplanes sp. TEM]|uniref:histidine kinase n=1 Tax=Rhodoplanes tepidamans TaxID=200616 RepID=A0ABT5J930_RHOTP|nr:MULTISPECIES: CHASE3 domain-containing protein [Rhodoplanes]MDC7786160.1 CHASE3 domain-containing protein [Rhodoplanes tepidamans]MDC7982827.1 CHASE3 domain-containing protein [Rhodoplanes sp. TEM]MDQ0357175.1 signal transduction histidine kinase [Rhodoplanes tepidamans]
MPISKFALIRSTVAAFLVGLAALLAIVGTTLWLVSEARTYSDLSVAVRLQRAALVDLRSLLQDTETGQRGFLLTAEDAYLAPYEQARRQLAAQLELVRERLSGDPSLAAPVARIAEIIDAKIAEMQDTIDLVRAGRRDDAVAIVRSDRGRALMEEARGIFDRLIRGAEDRIGDAVRHQYGTISWLIWVTLLGALVIVGVVAAAAWMATVYTRQLVAAQEEVRALNAGLEQRVAERTADLGRANDEIQRFAYIVTHDLRAPLVNIMGFTSELEASLGAIRAWFEKAGVPADDPLAGEARLAAVEDAPEAIGFIRSSTRKMDGLINAILKLSREGRRTLRPERVELGALLSAAAESIQHQVVEAGGEVTLAPDLPSVVSDRLALEQVFGNLLDNAVKYRSPDRPIRIAIRARPEPGQRILVEVEDNGRGIAPQDHERVFDLFRRSGAQDQPGEGIGLAHVRAMVRNLGGDVTLASEVGRGTTMRLNLPRDLRQVARTAGSEPT